MTPNTTGIDTADGKIRSPGAFPVILLAHRHCRARMYPYSYAIWRDNYCTSYKSGHRVNL